MSIVLYRLRMEEETRRIFVEWKAKHDKSYASIGEEEFWYALLKKARREIDQHNAEADAGLQSYRQVPRPQHVRRLHQGGKLPQLRRRKKLFSLLLKGMCTCRSYHTDLRIEEEETRQMFVEWKSKHEKNYTSIGEEEFRYAVFKKTRRIVDKHNAEADAGIQSYRLGLNIFTDSTNEEMSGNCFIHGLEEEALLSSAKIRSKLKPTPGFNHTAKASTPRILVTDRRRTRKRLFVIS
uniref:Cathepsin propeptide inhibitor domain-containing protein n=1 Tax=Leersia perrieri TaxID=77586 RepID=A0A0D9WB54_9ORYZ